MPRNPSIGHEQPHFDYWTRPDGPPKKGFSDSSQSPPAESAMPTTFSILGRLGNITLSSLHIIDARQSKFVEEFSDDKGLLWIPFSKSEATIALDGLNTTLTNVAEARINRLKTTDKKLKPVLKTYQKVESWRDDADQAMDLLHQAVKPSKGPIEPSTELIWSRQDIRATIANLLIAKTAFENWDWPAVNSPRRMSAEPQITEQLWLAPTAEVTAVWHIARRLYGQRRRAWNRQLTDARDNPFLQSALAYFEDESQVEHSDQPA